jgi:hypothetical protein
LAVADKTIASWKPVAVNGETNEVAEQPSWHTEAASPNNALSVKRKGS